MLAILPESLELQEALKNLKTEAEKEFDSYKNSLMRLPSFEAAFKSFFAYRNANQLEAEEYFRRLQKIYVALLLDGKAMIEKHEPQSPKYNFNIPLNILIDTYAEIAWKMLIVITKEKLSPWKPISNLNFKQVKDLLEKIYHEYETLFASNKLPGRDTPVADFDLFLFQDLQKHFYPDINTEEFVIQVSSEEIEREVLQKLLQSYLTECYIVSLKGWVEKDDGVKIHFYVKREKQVYAMLNLDFTCQNGNLKILRVSLDGPGRLVLAQRLVFPQKIITPQDLEPQSALVFGNNLGTSSQTSLTLNPQDNT